MTTDNKRTEYVVKAGGLTLGRTTDLKARGQPYATIEEVA